MNVASLVRAVSEPPLLVQFSNCPLFLMILSKLNPYLCSLNKKLSYELVAGSFFRADDVAGWL